MAGRDRSVPRRGRGGVLRTPRWDGRAAPGGVPTPTVPEAEPSARFPAKRERPWPHRNTPEAVAHRRDGLRRHPAWRDGDDRIFPDGAADGLAAAQEAFTGQMVLPVAVVGPLRVSLGHYETGDGGLPREVDRRDESLLLPLAHTEGGLSASIQRGILAANRDGGIRTHVIADGMTRDTCLVFSSVTEALSAGRFVEERAEEMRSWLSAHRARDVSGRRLVSGHARLVSVRSHPIGPMLHILYRFVTGEAAGPNMMTRNTYVLNEDFVLPRLRRELGLVPERVVLEANMGGDKKPSWLYFGLGGHGKTVIAECTLSEGTLRHLLHVTGRDLVELSKVGLHGAHESGMQSFAFTPASVVAAMFAVTGQDLGMVATSSMAHIAVQATVPGAVPADVDPSDPVRMRPYRQGGVHISLRFPGLEVGTVGGGTILPHAQTYLRLLGCSGPGSAHRLAQVVAAAALALEISAGSAMASPGSREFVTAHLRHGGLRSADDPPPTGGAHL
jgi:hydroxymethylglutaryl-CoA reductase (NADPH)